MTFALSNVLARKAQEHNVETKALAVFAGVMALSLPAAMAKEPSAATFAATQPSLLVLLASVGIAVFVINVVVQYGLAHVGANRAIAIFLFELVVAAIAAYYLAGETMQNARMDRRGNDRCGEFVFGKTRQKQDWGLRTQD